MAGTAALLDALHHAGVTRLVFSSTSAVYGTPDRLPVGEDQAVRPENPYGESKALVERMLYWYDACHGLRSVSLRYFNAAGAASDGSNGEDWTVTLNLVPLVMKALLGRSPELKVFGTDYPTLDGTAIRDYIHVDDLADAHLQRAWLPQRRRGQQCVQLGYRVRLDSTAGNRRRGKGLRPGGARRRGTSASRRPRGPLLGQREGWSGPGLVRPPQPG